ncbi:MAG: fused MFS/spermidine synthase [Micavibrio aeruginosavorus]|uniref:Fused MFS/spermidine synthase n=1 Tax=Micavibrio aeruginosavorus TaxID=349221 RepID=A0A7T5R326_9BACT|nr:MAG: fused MFS/spermidine synthase [Micavibrio aeruginosavorus]
MAAIPILYFIIFLEGYVVLSTELLAIRLMIPFAGSGADTISIIIAAILLPLACGYYNGGKPKRIRKQNNRFVPVRERLIFNLFVSTIILTAGLSYTFLDWFFDIAQTFAGLGNRIWLAILYAGCFMVVPVYLLGQTVPLVSNYFPKGKLPYLAGHILFYSTLGSFVGALFTTLVLMPFLGVHIAVTVTLGLLAVLLLLLQKKTLSFVSCGVAAVFILAVFVNSDQAMRRLGIVSNNQYNTVQIVEHDLQKRRTLEVNRSYASIVNQGNRDTVAPYISFIEKNIIDTAASENRKLSILVLGAGGFTVGRRDTVNDYTFVDLDIQLKYVSEHFFLKEKLSENKKFVAMDARSYLLQNKDLYDVIFIDLFKESIATPDEIMVREFFQEVKNDLREGGVMVANFVLSPNLSDEYSQNVDSTIRSVFPYINRHIAGSYSPWLGDADWINILYIYAHYPLLGSEIYSDNKNSALYDKPSFLIKRRRAMPERY